MKAQLYIKPDLGQATANANYSSSIMILEDNKLCYKSLTIFNVINTNLMKCFFSSEIVHRLLKHQLNLRVFHMH